MLIIGYLIRIFLGAGLALISATVSFMAATEANFSEIRTGLLIVSIPLFLLGCMITFKSTQSIVQTIRTRNDPQKQIQKHEQEQDEKAAKAKGLNLLRWILFLGIWFIGGYIIDVQLGGVWHAKGGNPAPDQFDLLVYNVTDDDLEVIPLSSLEAHRARWIQNGIEISFLLPDNAESIYTFRGGSDTHVSVREIAEGFQEITYGYEMGFMNHPTNTWKATALGVEPVSATRGSGAYFMSFLLAIGMLALWGLFNLISKIVNKIRRSQ